MKRVLVALVLALGILSVSAASIGCSGGSSTTKKDTKP
jgi:hypothetical protein